LEENEVLKKYYEYMKKNAKSDKQFTLNSHVRERLEMWGLKLKVEENF
jgi:hypothetical protein